MKPKMLDLYVVGTVCDSQKSKTLPGLLPTCVWNIISYNLTGCFYNVNFLYIRLVISSRHGFFRGRMLKNSLANSNYGLL